MSDSPNRSEKLPWNRYWSPRGDDTSGGSSGFLEDPMGVFGRHLHPNAAPLEDIVPKKGLLVLCGEPGLGKSTELGSLKKQLVDSAEPIIHFEARTFGSFLELQNHVENHSTWEPWLEGSILLTILIDGIDEGMIRIPTLVEQLRMFLDEKPVERLRLVLSCRSFEWPESEGQQLSALWKPEADVSSVFELQPLSHQDAVLAAEQRGQNGSSFLEAVHRKDVAALASRPLTLFFLLDEFDGTDFHVSSRSELFKNGCQRLCEESNPNRAFLLRHHPEVTVTSDEKYSVATKLAAILLLAGNHAITSPFTTRSPASLGNILDTRKLIGATFLTEAATLQTLGTGLFNSVGPDAFGFAHQTFAECLAGQELARLSLAQLRTLLLETDQATGEEYVIPQLTELTAWVAGNHLSLFDHLLSVDPASLLRSGMDLATSDQKSRLIDRILTLAHEEKFFDESGYWRLWGNLDHPDLPEQLTKVLSNPKSPRVAQRVVLAIADECKRPELVPALFDFLQNTDRDRYIRASAAEALCQSMPEERLSELEPLARREIGPDPDQSILGHALKRLVPAHWSVSQALPYLSDTANPNLFGSYWGTLDRQLPEHLTDDDILPGLRTLQNWETNFSTMSFRRNLSMEIFRQAISRIDEPEICAELVKLWNKKARTYHEFFRSGDRDDSDFITIEDDHRRKWITAIFKEASEPEDDTIDHLTWDTYRLIKPEDFPWLLQQIVQQPAEQAPLWAAAIRRLIWSEDTRIAHWDAFIRTYRESSALQEEMSWFEETSLSTPKRRSEKARWLWHDRRVERIQSKRKQPPRAQAINEALTQIANGEAWAFKNLCWALSLDEQGYNHGHLKHDIAEYPAWETISDQQRAAAKDAARKFLLKCSDGYDNHHTRTNYSDPGVVAVWTFLDEIETDPDLRTSIAKNWIEAILGTWDSNSQHAKSLFSLAYRIAPERTVAIWLRQLRRATETGGHPFDIRRAADCFDRNLQTEIFAFLKTVRAQRSLRMAIYELRDINKDFAGKIAAYMLARVSNAGKPSPKLVEDLLVAGLGTENREVWTLAFPLLLSDPTFAKKAILKVVDDTDSRNTNFCSVLHEDEIADLYLMLHRLFPPSQDPPEKSGIVTPRRAAAYFRSSVIDSLASRATMDACKQLSRLAHSIPDERPWLRRRQQQTLSSVRRADWRPNRLDEIAPILVQDEKRIIRDQNDLLNLVIESLGDLQNHLTNKTLPAVEDLWHWDGAGLARKNFRHKDEEAASDYIARWLRDRIGPDSKIVVNREVQPERRNRTDILVQAWTQTARGRDRDEIPLSVTIEVKGCWNKDIKTGSEKQLLDQYLRPYGQTHGIFLAAWFFSPESGRQATRQPSHLRTKNPQHARRRLSEFVKPAQIPGYQILPFLLDCRLS